MNLFSDSSQGQSLYGNIRDNTGMESILTNVFWETLLASMVTASLLFKDLNALTGDSSPQISIGHFYFTCLVVYSWNYLY